MNLPSGTVTTLFTDIEGSTRLWELQSEAMGIALPAHDIILREAIESKQGHVVKTTGDGIHAAFATAFNAVEAVIAAQRALILYPWDENCQLKVRMAYTPANPNRDPAIITDPLSTGLLV